MASLLVVSGASEGDYYLLRRDAVVIGRDDECPIQIVDQTVSRRHVEVRREDDRDAWRIADLGSANGTIVNDLPIRGGAMLKDGDLIRIGETEVMFMAEDFTDGETAFQHYRRRGEGDRSTIIRRR